MKRVIQSYLEVPALLRTLLLVSLSGLICTGMPLNLYAQSDCTVGLHAAETAYSYGRFTTVVDTLRSCFHPEVHRYQQGRAHQLAANAFFALDQPELAREHIRILVREIDRDYAPPDDAPLFIKDLVEEFRPRPWYAKPWVWIGGGAAGLSAILIFRDHPPDPLRDPPDTFLPTNP